MSPAAVQVSGDPGEVWRVGFAPDPWQWTPWEYAKDEGRFNGRWDDQLAQFRTLYTSDTLLGCFIELLAHERPNDIAFAELERIVDDDDSVTRYPDAERGALGLDWLSDRRYGHGTQDGTTSMRRTGAHSSTASRSGAEWTTRSGYGRFSNAEMSR